MMKGLIRAGHVLLLATWWQQLPCSLAGGLRVTTEEEYGEGVSPIDNEITDMVVSVEHTSPRYFSIRNPQTGLVLDIPYGSCVDRTNLIVWDYHGADNQLFYFGAHNTIVSKLCNKVLDIDGAVCVPGAKLILWPAHYGANQVFKMGNGSIFNPACRTAIDMIPSAHRGDGVILWPNHGGWNQKWNIILEITPTPTATPSDTPTATPSDTPTATPSDTPTATPSDTPSDAPTARKYFSIRNPLTGKVLDIPYGSCVDGTNLIVWDYHGADNQLFYFGTHNTIVSKLCNKVLDIQGALCVPGAKLILWPAHYGANQVFKMKGNGSIFNPGCRTVIDMIPSARSGDGVILWPPHDSWNQKWVRKYSGMVAEMVAEME